jgi:hypothetical protein
VLTIVVLPLLLLLSSGKNRNGSEPAVHAE